MTTDHEHLWTWAGTCARCGIHDDDPHADELTDHGGWEDH